MTQNGYFKLETPDPRPQLPEGVTDGDVLRAWAKRAAASKLTKRRGALEGHRTIEVPNSEWLALQRFIETFASEEGEIGCVLGLADVQDATPARRRKKAAKKADESKPKAKGRRSAPASMPEKSNFELVPSVDEDEE